MVSSTTKLVYNAFSQLFPDNTLSCFINFLLEQLNLECQWEVATSIKSYPTRYQNVKKRPHNAENAHKIACIQCFMTYTDLIEYNTFGDTKVPLMRCFFYFKTRNWRQINNWTVLKLRDL